MGESVTSSASVRPRAGLQVSVAVPEPNRNRSDLVDVVVDPALHRAFAARIRRERTQLVRRLSTIRVLVVERRVLLARMQAACANVQDASALRHLRELNESRDARTSVRL